MCARVMFVFPHPREIDGWMEWVGDAPVMEPRIYDDEENRGGAVGAGGEGGIEDV